jgi:hypothetical protein
MTYSASALRKLATLNLSAEQMAGVLEIMAESIEADEARKAAQRERTRRARERARTANVTLQSRDCNSDDTRARVTRVEDKTSNSEIEPQNQERNALAREFDQFWAEYPNKVGKPKAKTSFAAARKRAGLDEILSGLRRYVAAKPADRAWLNPSTFLNQDRWADQPAPVSHAREGPPAKRRTMMDALDDFESYLNGQANSSSGDETPQGVVLSLPKLATG